MARSCSSSPSSGSTTRTSGTSGVAILFRSIEPAEHLPFTGNGLLVARRIDNAASTLELTADVAGLHHRLDVCRERRHFVRVERTHEMGRDEHHQLRFLFALRFA